MQLFRDFRVLFFPETEHNFKTKPQQLNSNLFLVPRISKPIVMFHLLLGIFVYFFFSETYQFSDNVKQ